MFESLAGEPLAAGEVAQRLETDPSATGKLLTALHTLGYLHLKGERYTLTSVARRHLLKESPHSLYDAIMFRFIEWKWLGHLEDFVSTGTPLWMHDEMSNEAWDSYIRMMASGARVLASLITEAEPRSFQEFARWQAEAGLVPQKPLRFVTAPGLGQQSALKPI